MDATRDRIDDFPSAAAPTVPDIPIGKTPIREAAYRPYRFELRFLPKPLRFLKDVARAEVGVLSEAIGRAPGLGGAWNRAISAAAVREIERAGLLFIHIPKTGGTSITKVLYRRNLPHFGAAFYARHAPATLGRLTAFAVIRDPVERAMSAWRFVRDGGSDDVTYSLYDRWRTRGLERFDDFVAFLAQGDLAHLPATFHEQVGYVTDAHGRLIVDRLFPFRSSEGPPRGLVEWLGTPIPHLNASHAYEVRCSSESLERLHRIYARDLRLYRRLIAGDVGDSVRGLSIA